MSDKTVHRLVDALLEGATSMDAGTFSMDAGAAARKMAEFQYADPGRFLVPLTEGLLGLAAKEVAVHTDGMDIVVDGVAVEFDTPAETLAALFTHGLETGDSRQTRALGRVCVAIDMALRDDTIARVVAVLRGGATHTIAVYRAGQEPNVMQRPSSAESRGLQIVFDRGWRDGFPANVYGASAFEHLRDAVEHSRERVSLDGVSLSGTSRPWEFRQYADEEGLRLMAGLDQERDVPSRVELWSCGVKVDEEDLPGATFGAQLDLDAVYYDLSRMAVVRNDTVIRGLERAQALRDACLRKLEALEAEWREGTRHERWPRERVSLVLAGKPAPKDGAFGDRLPAVRTSSATLLDWKLGETPGLDRALIGLGILGIVVGLQIGLAGMTVPGGALALVGVLLAAIGALRTSRTR